jgi:hypothetical protein
MCTYDKLKKQRDRLIDAAASLIRVQKSIDFSMGLTIGSSELYDRDGQQCRASLQKSDLLESEIDMFKAFVDVVQLRLENRAAFIQMKLNDVEILLKEVA